MRGRPPSIREEELLDAARDVFRAEGHAATTAKIAKQAGVSEGILFYRYKTKEALLAAVIRRETQPSEALSELVAEVGTRSVAKQLERITGEVLEAVVQGHPFVELALTSPKSGEIHRLLFAQGTKPAPQLMVELVEGYLEAERRLGRVRNVHTNATARAIIGGCIDYVRSGQVLQDGGDSRGFVRGLAGVLTRGVARTPASSR